MIEYIGEVIKASAGESLCVVAKVVDAYGDVVENCHFSLFDGDERLYMAMGELNAEGHYEFHIPAEATANLKGRYNYCVCDENMISLCFKCFIYFV